MPSTTISPNLYQRCRTVFLECDEFKNNGSLGAVFAAPDLQPFQKRLPQATNPAERVNKCLEYLLGIRSASGRAGLSIFLDTLCSFYEEGDSRREKLKQLSEAVKAVLEPVPSPQALLSPQQEPTPSTNSSRVKQRRIDAAVPSHAQVNEPIYLFVQVRFPNSPVLGIKDWPIEHRPSSVEQARELVTLKHPIDPRTGKAGSARLEIQVEAPDFVIEGPSHHRIEVPPDKLSKCVRLLLTPRKAGVDYITVIVRDDDGMTLGTIPIETSVGEASKPQTAVVASLLILVVMVGPEAPHPRGDARGGSDPVVRNADESPSRPLTSDQRQGHQNNRSSVLILVYVFASIALGLVSNALANTWQVNTPPRAFIAVGVFCLALAAFLWTEFRREDVRLSGLSLFGARAFAVIGALGILVGSISASATWSYAPSPISTITPSPAPECKDIQFSHLELVLATGELQRKDPNEENGIVVLAQSEIAKLTNLQGKAVFAASNIPSSCTCDWQAEIDGGSKKNVTSGTMGCWFSTAIPKSLKSILLNLSIGGQPPKSFIIKIQQ